jgi:alkaline phosphatase
MPLADGLFFSLERGMKRNKSKLTAALALLAILWVPVMPQSSDPGFPVKREESRETWRSGGVDMIARATQLKFKRRKAKNVILFIGDGMGVSTITASRILEGQLRGESGEENLLSFDKFPFIGLSKTYSANQQTSDSAPTMSAIITGIKTDEGVLSIDQNVVRGDYRTAKGNETVTMLELAELSGRSTGVVSTARVTHATPAACYAHTPDRDWESDADIQRRSKDAAAAGFPDIARQLIEFPYGNGLEVAMGGGRYNFLPTNAPDPEAPENPKRNGKRLDKRDLTKEWLAKFEKSKYVWNREQFEAVDPRNTDHLLGLFEGSHMQYEYDRERTGKNEPSLSEMTSKAIDILSRNKKGFFLMVEGGRIDHAHHDGNAFRALTETIELSNAVRTARSKVDLDDTLIIVTADHSHTFTIAGYPARGNNILGLVREVGEDGNISETPAQDASGQPYTTLGYRNGLGHRKGERKAPTQEEATDPEYLQEALIPFGSETHAGEDVAIFAEGVNAWMVHGVMEENWIFYVMREALRIDESKLLKKR